MRGIDYDCSLICLPYFIFVSGIVMKVKICRLPEARVLGKSHSIRPVVSESTYPVQSYGVKLMIDRLVCIDIMLCTVHAGYRLRLADLS